MQYKLADRPQPTQSHTEIWILPSLAPSLSDWIHCTLINSEHRTSAGIIYQRTWSLTVRNGQSKTQGKPRNSFLFERIKTATSSKKEQKQVEEKQLQPRCYVIKTYLTRLLHPPEPAGPAT